MLLKIADSMISQKMLKSLVLRQRKRRNLRFGLRSRDPFVIMRKLIDRDAPLIFDVGAHVHAHPCLLLPGLGGESRQLTVLGLDDDRGAPLAIDLERPLTRVHVEGVVTAAAA